MIEGNFLPNIPTERKLSQAERFCEGLRLLALECGLHDVTVTGFGPRTFTFNDGSSVGSMRAMFIAGLVNEQRFNSQYLRKDTNI